MAVIRATGPSAKEASVLDSAVIVLVFFFASVEVQLLSQVIMIDYKTNGQ